MGRRTIAFSALCVTSCLIVSAHCADNGPATRGEIQITVDPQRHQAISPYIYGLNFATKVEDVPAGITFDRTGGNRWTAYNWEINTSNAGSDYQYQNDRYLGDSNEPGGIVFDLIAEDRKRGMASLVTLQMQGYVAADDKGPVSMASPPDLKRFRKVVPAKAAVSSEPFTAKPDTRDDAVYMDEFVWAIDHKFSGQGVFAAKPAKLPVFLSLDNEPELWNHTHAEIQGTSLIKANDYILRSIVLASAVKQQFPDAVVFAPAHFGFMGVYNWFNELSATPTGNNWFIDRYLAALKAASATAGRPLVDVYDVHWYSEAADGAGQRVVGLNGPKLTDDQVQAVVQAPRSFWDRSYRESSWIAKDVLGQPIALLPRLKSRIDAVYPALKLALTEYNNGGGQHIAGTIAQADNLGAFGAFGLFAASQWQMSPKEPYILGGFRAYRDFDGAGHHFGDTSVHAESSDPSRVVVWTSTDSARPGRVVMVAINRSAEEQVAVVAGQPLSGTAHLFRISATSAAKQSSVRPVAAGTQPVSGDSLRLSLPPLSVTTIDVY